MHLPVEFAVNTLFQSPVHDSPLRIDKYRYFSTTNVTRKRSNFRSEKIRLQNLTIKMHKRTAKIVAKHLEQIFKIKS